MWMDSTNLFSDQQAITATARSTNQIDLGTPGTTFSGQSLVREIGPGKELEVWCSVDADFATLTSLSVSLRCDNDTAFGSPKTLWTSAAVVTASLVAGYRFKLPCIPWGVDERYLELYYTVAGSSATTGKVTAGLTLVNQTNPTV